MDPARINLTEDRFGLSSLAFRPGNRATLQGLEYGDVHWSVDILIQPHDDVQTVEIDESGQKVSRRIPEGEFFTGLELLASPGVEAYKLAATFALTGLELRGAGLPQKKAFAEILREAAADRSWPLELRIVDESRSLRLTEQGRVILRDLADRLEAEGRVATGLMISRKLEVPAGALEALRRRISRRSLQAYKVRGRWYVALENLTREPRQPVPAVTADAPAEPNEPVRAAEEAPAPPADSTAPESEDTAASPESITSSIDLTATTADESEDVPTAPAPTAVETAENEVSEPADNESEVIHSEEMVPAAPPESEITTQLASVSLDDTQTSEEPDAMPPAPELDQAPVETAAVAEQDVATQSEDQHADDGASVPSEADASELVDDTMRDALEQEAAAVDAFFISPTETSEATDYLFTRVQETVQVSVATDVPVADDAPESAMVGEATPIAEEADGADPLADAGVEETITDVGVQDSEPEAIEPSPAVASADQVDDLSPTELSETDFSSDDARDAAGLVSLSQPEDVDLRSEPEIDVMVDRQDQEIDAAVDAPADSPLVDAEDNDVDARVDVEDLEHGALLDVATAPGSDSSDPNDAVPSTPEQEREPESQPDASEPITTVDTPEPVVEPASVVADTIIENQEVAAEAPIDLSTAPDLAALGESETLDVEADAGQDLEFDHEPRPEPADDEPAPSAEPDLTSPVEVVAVEETESITTDAESVMDQWDAEPDQAATWEDQGAEGAEVDIPDDVDSLIETLPTEVIDDDDEGALTDVSPADDGTPEPLASETIEQQVGEPIAIEPDESPEVADQEFEAASTSDHAAESAFDTPAAEPEVAAEDVLVHDTVQEQSTEGAPPDQAAEPEPAAAPEPERDEPASAEEQILIYLREEVTFLRQQVQEKDRQIAAWAEQPQRVEAATHGRERTEQRVMKPLNRKNGNGTGYQVLESEMAVSSEQLGAIRDEWLQPLVDQIRYLEHQVGRMQGERSERQSVRVNELQTEKDALTQRLATLETELVSARQVEAPRLPWYRRLW